MNWWDWYAVISLALLFCATGYGLYLIIFRWPY